MENVKQWWQSKTMWAGIVTLVIGVLGMTGLADLEGQQGVIVEKIMQIVTGLGSLVVLYGRATAKSVIAKKPPMNKSVILLLCLLLLMSGCSVYMSPEYQADVSDAAAAINGLNENCQAGDPNACSQGLAEAAKTVNMILDASYGR